MVHLISFVKDLTQTPCALCFDMQESVVFIFILFAFTEFPRSMPVHAMEEPKYGIKNCPSSAFYAQLDLSLTLFLIV